MHTKNEIVEMVKEIAEGMDAKSKRAEELKNSVLIDRGRLEELRNLHNILVEDEAKEEEKNEEILE